MDFTQHCMWITTQCRSPRGHFSSRRTSSLRVLRSFVSILWLYHLLPAWDMNTAAKTLPSFCKHYYDSFARLELPVWGCWRIQCLGRQMLALLSALLRLVCTLRTTSLGWLANSMFGTTDALDRSSLSLQPRSRVRRVGTDN